MAEKKIVTEKPKAAKLPVKRPKAGKLPEIKVTEKKKIVFFQK